MTVAFLVGFWALAVPAETRAERLPIKSYTIADGLAHDGVNRIVPDSSGFLWLCTAAGLSRFDGYTFLNFGSDHGLPSAPVNDLLETKAGKYWIATNEGLVRFNPAGQPQPAVLHDGDERAALAMFVVVLPADSDRRARAIIAVREGKDGTIWVGTRRGLYRLVNDGGRQALRAVDIAMPNEFPIQRDIVDVLEDSRGALWVATPVALHRRWPDGTTAAYPMTDRFNEVSDLFEDSSRHIWVASRHHGLSRLAVDEGHTAPRIEFTLTTRDGLPSPWVTQVLETSDGRVWVATSSGLAELLPGPDQSGRRLRSYTVRNGLTHGYLSALTEDASGNLWLSTTNAGVMKLVRGGFTTYGRADGIDGIGAIFDDAAGNVCFRGQVLSEVIAPSYRGSTLAWLRQHPEWWHPRVGCLKGEAIEWFHPAAVVHPGWVTRKVTLQARSGEWWFGSADGLFHYRRSDSLTALETAKPLAIYTTADGLASNQVFGLFEDSVGNVWISTTAAETNGLARWDRETGRPRDMAGLPGLPSLASEVPRSFAEDAAGAVWIGFTGSVVRYSSGVFRSFGAADGVPAGQVNYIYADAQHRLWLASSQGGLTRIDDPESSRPAFVRYTRANGLSSDDVEVITEDRDGRLYFGGGNGVDRLDPRTRAVKHFTAADGLPSGILTSAHRDRSGALWIGLSTGLARVIPLAEPPATAPPTWITGLRVSGTAQQLSARGERHVSLPDLPSGQNQVQIDFVALAFGTGEVIRYQYKLQGAESDWSPLTDQRTVMYAALSPGVYTFMVRAVNSDAVASEQPALVTFRILPPLWLRWWFLTLAASAVALLVHAFYRRRVARLLELANLRTRIAADLHDDVGANLTRIALLSEVAQRTGTLSGEDAVVAAPLVSIARIARESVASMGDIVWAINPARDSVADLTGRMRRHAEDLFMHRGIELSFSAPADEHVKLGTDVRRDVLLVFKEAASNAARHSGCSRIDILLEVHRSHLVLVIADDGAGFDTSHEREGQGLSSLRRRAQRMKGTIDIVSSAGIGTTVRLVVKR